MSAVAAPTLPPDVDRQLEGMAPAELAVSVPTYNNVTTVSLVLEAVRAGLEKHFAHVAAVLINADAGSSDATLGRVAEAGVPPPPAAHPAPPAAPPPPPLPRGPRPRAPPPPSVARAGARRRP